MIDLMKKTTLLILLAFALVACAPVLTSVPESTEPQLGSQTSESVIPDEPSQTLAANFAKEDAVAADSSEEPTPTEEATQEESSNSFIETLFPPTSTATSDGQKTLFAAPLQQSNCYYGCSDTVFDVADTLFADSLYYPIGLDKAGQWINVLGPKNGRSCWLPASAIDLQYGNQSVQPSDLSASTLLTISCPANPTPLPGDTANDDTPADQDALSTSSIEWGPAPASQPGRYARLMHDPQWMDWPSRIAAPDWPKSYSYDWYPETVPLWVTPKGGDGRFDYSVQWLEYLRYVQANDDAAVWIARVAAGLFNRTNVFIPILDLDQLEELPTAEAISAGGNVVKVLEIRSGSIRIETIFNQYGPPDPGIINYYSTPWLVTKFTAVSIDGQLGHPGGIDVYFPNLSRQAEGYWVDKNRVELFPVLPFHASVRETITLYDAPSTSANSTDDIEPGEIVIIEDYLPQASDVWARIDGGWILLEYQNSKGVPIYTTSWSMETRPPILFP